MNKLFTLITALLVTLTATAYDAAVSGTTYYGSNCAAWGLDDGTVAIYQYYTTEGQTEVTFPSTIQVWSDTELTAEYEVSAVGVDGWNNTYLGSTSTYQYTGTVTSLIFAEGIKTINAGAFYEMTSLESLTLPSTLTTIAGYAFTDCDALQSITTKATHITLGADAFKGKSSWDYIAANCMVTIPAGSLANFAAYSFDNTLAWTYWDAFYSYGNLVESTDEGGDPDLDDLIFQTYPDGHALVVGVNDFLRGGDISMLNYVEDLGAKFYDAAGNERDPLDIMQENGVNIVRLRLYNNPGNTVTYTDNGTQYTYALPAGYLDQADVLNLAQRAKAHGLKIELTFHYSDFWTNGGMQFKPKDWQNYNMAQLKNAMYDYTYDFLQQMNAQGTPPDYVSLGNEIQGGILFGYYTSDMSQINSVNGYCSNMANLAALLNRGSAAVRAACPDAKVIIHLTLSSGVRADTYTWFFDEMKSKGLDYDLIGASYYPYWVNEKPTMLTGLASQLYSAYGKELMIMEVGYAWTQYRPAGRYGGNYEGQLSLNGSVYNEASQAGQKAFMQEVNAVVSAEDSHILGYLYWDPLMVEQKVNGSWIPTGWVQGGGNMVGNSTWFDYDGKALPVFEAIKEAAATIPEILPETVTINGTEYIVETQAPLEIEISGVMSGNVMYDTFYDDCGRLIPEGITAYTAQSISSPSMELNVINGENIPASTGVVLTGQEGTYYFWQRDDNTIIENNVLSGTATQIAKPDGMVYTLGKQTETVGFYLFDGETIPAHKAYYLVIGLRGDVNGNGDVSIADVTILIDYLLSGDATGVNLDNADCNSDHNITIADVTTLIDYLLSGEWN